MAFKLSRASPERAFRNLPGAVTQLGLKDQRRHGQCYRLNPGPLFSRPV